MTRREIRDATGATNSQIEYWTRCGWLPDAHYEHRGGPGNDRTYSANDADAIRLAVKAIKQYGPSSARYVLLRFKARRAS